MSRLTIETNRVKNDLCQVEQIGAACHTGRKDCFYLYIDLDKLHVTVDGNLKK
tara:strand:- start:3068 stop:3226 length:159 start_codon:yes stop_codon:yes gene_type:complete